MALLLLFFYCSRATHVHTRKAIPLGLSNIPKRSETDDMAATTTMAELNIEFPVDYFTLGGALSSQGRRYGVSKVEGRLGGWGRWSLWVAYQNKKLGRWRRQRGSSVVWLILPWRRLKDWECSIRKMVVIILINNWSGFYYCWSAQSPVLRKRIEKIGFY